MDLDGVRESLTALGCLAKDRVEDLVEDFLVSVVEPRDKIDLTEDIGDRLSALSRPEEMLTALGSPEDEDTVGKLSAPSRIEEVLTALGSLEEDDMDDSIDGITGVFGASVVDMSVCVGV